MLPAIRLESTNPPFNFVRSLYTRGMQAWDATPAWLQVVESKGLQKHPSWLNKCVQLYETYQVRHGIMVVGPAGSGKSAIIDCVAGALTEMGNKHVIWRMNPKAITAPQMFGRMDAATGDWLGVCRLG